MSYPLASPVRGRAFISHEKYLTHKYFAAQTRSKRIGVTADVMAGDSQTSTGYWEIFQDALADLVRIMMVRCCDEKTYPQMYEQVRNLRGQVWVCAFHSVFITIAPTEVPKTMFPQAVRQLCMCRSLHYATPYVSNSLLYRFNEM